METSSFSGKDERLTTFARLNTFESQDFLTARHTPARKHRSFMNPQMVAIAGPLKGTIFELSQDETTIGRDVENDISLNDKLVSRRHCVIKKEDGKFVLLDLNSHNSTFINDVPVNEQGVNHGDTIRVGTSFFLFLTHLKSDASTEAVQLDEGTLVPLSSIRFQLKDALYSLAHELNVLMKIGTLLSSIRSLAELQRQLIESILEIVPAERGAILTLDDSLDSLSSVMAVDKRPGMRRAMHVSRTVARQVLSDRVAILSNDIIESDRLNKSESLIASKVRSLLCVPLALPDRIIGIIYLDTSEGQTEFNESHLRAVSAIAGFAAGALESVRHIEELENENNRLRANARLQYNMIGESQRLRDVYQFISKVAPTDSTALIRGESGTGKELVAHAIHRNSGRADKPFIAVNCAALTETLLESELFGHEKGAFTGAVSQKKGKLEMAEGGTVFLDEVGEMTPSIQSKLLRVLQEREFERVGGTRAIKLNIRVIAATNRNLEEAIANGLFRRDFYYRLNVVSLTMPPLRERGEDIPLLANYFAAKYADRCKRRVTGLSPETHQCMMSYDWPGNVRELENAIERAVVLGSTEVIRPEDLPEVVLEAAAASAERFPTKYHDSVREAKKQLILNSLEQAGGSYAEAARLLGIHPNNLHRLIRNLNLKAARGG